MAKIPAFLVKTTWDGSFAHIICSFIYVYQNNKIKNPHPTKSKLFGLQFSAQGSIPKKYSRENFYGFTIQNTSWGYSDFKRVKQEMKPMEKIYKELQKIERVKGEPETFSEFISRAVLVLKIKKFAFFVEDEDVLDDTYNGSVYAITNVEKGLNKITEIENCFFDRIKNLHLCKKE